MIKAVNSRDGKNTKRRSRRRRRKRRRRRRRKRRRRKKGISRLVLDCLPFSISRKALDKHDQGCRFERWGKHKKKKKKKEEEKKKKKKKEQKIEGG